VRRFLSYLVALTLLAMGPLMPDTVQANCDVIPQTSTVFRGALGSLDRPYAQPGDQLTLSKA
jgi:hypothetical protein